jgi:ABC-type transport system involved in multi-copper enzyme maturation permease subunit
LHFRRIPTAKIIYKTIVRILSDEYIIAGLSGPRCPAHRRFFGDTVHNPSRKSRAFAVFAECLSKELLANILSYRYPLVLVLTIASALFVTGVRVHVYKKQVTDYHQAAHDWRQTMDSMKWEWQSVGLGLCFEKRPEPLSIFAFGLENEMTRSINFCEYYPDHAGMRKLGATSFQYFSQIDLATVVYFGCSLLALILVFDAMSGARERGMLRILLSGPISRSTLIIAKIASGFITLAVPLLLSWGLCLMYAMIASGYSFLSGDLARIAGMAGVSMLFISAVFSVGLAASCWAASSNSSLVITLFAWFFMVLFLPAGARAMSDLIHPVPSFASVEEDISGIQNAVHDENVMREIAQEVVEKNPGINVESDLMWRKMQELLAEKGRKIEELRENKVRNNVRMYSQLLRVSPAWSYVSAVTAMAGTGAEDYLKFISDVRLFHHEFVAASANQAGKAAAKAADVPYFKMYNPYSPDLWPEFAFTKTPLRNLAPSIAVDCGWICGAMVLFLLIAVLGFVRREVV